MSDDGSDNGEGERTPGPSPASVAYISMNNVMLSEMVTVLQETKAKLTLNVKELKEKMLQQNEDQADIYYYLNKKCDDSFEVITSLEEQLLSEQGEREIAEKLAERKIEELILRSSNEENRLKGIIKDLEDRLFAVNEFAAKKDEVDRILEEQKLCFETERTIHKQSMEDAENRWTRERAKLRSDYERRVSELRQEVDSLVEDKLSKQTKKTRILNALIKQELSQQSKEADKVLEFNQQVIDRDRELRIQLQLAQSSEKEIMSRLSMYQRVIKQLNERIAKDTQTFELSHENILSQLQLKENEIIKLRAELAKELEDHRSLQGSVDDVWIYLSEALKYVKDRMRLEDGPIILGSASYSSSFPAPSPTKQIAQNSTQNKYEKMLVDIILSLVHRHPKRFEAVIKEGFDKAPFPKLHEGDSSSVSGVLLPVIASPNRMQANTKDEERDPMSSDAQQEETTRDCKSVGVQTESRISPYPAGSSWLSHKLHADSFPVPSYLVLSSDNDQDVIRSQSQLSGYTSRRVGNSIFSTDPGADDMSVKSLSAAYPPSSVVHKFNTHRRRNPRPINVAADKVSNSSAMISVDTLRDKREVSRTVLSTTKAKNIARLNAIDKMLQSSPPRAGYLNLKQNAGFDRSASQGVGNDDISVSGHSFSSPITTSAMSTKVILKGGDDVSVNSRHSVETKRSGRSIASILPCVDMTDEDGFDGTISPTSSLSMSPRPDPE